MFLCFMICVPSFKRLEVDDTAQNLAYHALAVVFALVTAILTLIYEHTFTAKG
ncbi:MAG: hypothetical protein KBH51_01280 [Synergistales bacterium]|nr:hypothetical protein [Synergistales bacterium]